MSTPVLVILFLTGFAALLAGWAEHRTHMIALGLHYKHCGYAAFRTNPRALTGSDAFECPHCKLSVDIWEITQEEIGYIQASEGVTRQQYQDLIAAADKCTAAYSFEEEVHSSAIAHVSEKV